MTTTTPVSAGPALPASPAPSHLRILTLSCVFPNASSPEYGIFVQRRVEAMSEGASIRVIAPVPLLDYSRGVWRKGTKDETIGNNLNVSHPRWFYPPGVSAGNPVFLAARLLPLLARIRRESGFSVIDAHFGFPDGIAGALLARWFGVRFVITLRGNETMHARHPLRRFMLRFALRRADRVVCLSQELLRFALGLGVEPTRAALLPNGVDAALFYLRDRDMCRRKHGLPQHTRIILSSGSLIERKGHHKLVKILARLREQGREVMLVIAGGPGREGNFERQILDEIRAQGQQDAVRLTGAVSPGAMAELMCAADVLCLASTREGWPNVVHEALACGTPVVSTNVGAVAQMISSREYGRIVSSDSHEALYAAVSEVLDLQWDHASISRWGRSRSWSHVGRDVLEQMEGVFRESGAAKEITCES